MAKTPEREVLKLAIELMTREMEKDSNRDTFTTREIYDLVRVEMEKNYESKNGEAFEDSEDMQTYKGRNTTKLLSTVQNLVSHRKLTVGGFDIEENSKGKGFKVKGEQTRMNLDDGSVVVESNVGTNATVRKAKQEDYEEIRELMYKYLVVTTNIQHGQARAVIENISESSLLDWVNAVGGVNPHKIKMETGNIARERSKGISDIKNYDEMVSLMMEAILSNKPVVFIRDYDNDGISCGSVMEVLLKEVEALGIEHKVEVFQTIGGETRGINEADTQYFERMKELYPDEDVAYCFTMDNGVSLHDNFMEIYRKMGYKSIPKTGIIDHHAPDKDANLEDFLHFNPELDDNEVVKPSAGGMMAALAVEAYKKIAKQTGKEYSSFAIEHLQRIGEHANQADMVAVGLDHLPMDLALQTKAGQIGGQLNAYVKYENFFRNPEKFQGYLDQITDGDSHQLMQDFLFLSKKAEIIMNNRHKSLSDIRMEVLESKTSFQEGNVSPDSISDLRQFITTNSYDTDPNNIALAEYALGVFEDLKRLDKKISSSLRENRDQHIIGDYMVNGVFLRIYNPKSKASTKAIDAAFPKPTTGYTLSITPRIDEDGKIRFARGGYRSTVDGGHHNFEELNNKILKILFKGHSNAAGAFLDVEACSEKAFETIMLNTMEAAGEIVKKIDEEEGNRQQIIRISEEDIYQIEALSAVNTLFSAHLFAIKAGFRMTLKGDYINRLLKNVDESKPWGAIPLTFGGQVLIVPNKEYGEDDNVVFDSLPGGSWITDGNVVDGSKTEILKGIYDKQSEEMKILAEEAYREDNPLNRSKMTFEDAEEVIGASRGAKNAKKGALEATGYTVRGMFDTGTRFAMIYDIEATGSTAGVEQEVGKSDESRMGKTPSEVINGQFVIHQITGGQEIPKGVFEKRSFYLRDGKRVLLTVSGYARMTNELRGLGYAPEDVLSIKEARHFDSKASEIFNTVIDSGEYDELYSVEEDKDPVVYNHGLESVSLDYLIDIEGEIPPSVVSLTHITNDILKKYGHDKEKVNAALEEAFDKYLAELGEDEIITIAAHNIVYDARMTPQTLPFFKKLEQHEKVVLIDTVHTVKAEQKRTTSFAQFEFNGFKKFVQVFKNPEGKGKIHNSYYVLEDFLLAKRPESYLVNLTTQGERFRYIQNGSKLALVYDDGKTQQLIIDDVTEMSPEVLKETIKYDVAKPTRYSMQLIMDLMTLNGMMFAHLDKPVVKNPPLEGLFDTIQDENLKGIIMEYMGAYRFTYSQYQNMVYLRESIISFKDENGNEREMHVSEYLKNMMGVQFLERMSTYADRLKAFPGNEPLREEMKEFFADKKLEKFVAMPHKERMKVGMAWLKKAARDEVEKMVEAKEDNIVGMFEDFLLDNKDLAELYDLKVIAHSILPTLKNMPWPLQEAERDSWLALMHADTGIDRETLSKIVSVINDNANIMGESPFKAEPHANIGHISDVREEDKILAAYNNMNQTPLNKERTYHNQKHDRSLQTLKSTIQRAKAAAAVKMEVNVKKENGLPDDFGLREGVTDSMLKTANQRAYVIPNKGVELDKKDYDKIEETLNGYYSILAYENSLLAMVKSLHKNYVAAEMDPDEGLILDEAFKQKVLDKKDETINGGIEELDDKGYPEGEQLMYECIRLNEMVQNLQPKKEALRKEIEENKRWKVEFNNKGAVSRKLLDSTRDFFEYLLSKEYKPAEKEDRYENLIRDDAKMEMPKQEPFVEELLKDTMDAMNKIIKFDPKFKANKERYEVILHNFLLNKVSSKAFIKDVAEIKNPPYTKSFTNAFAHLDKNPNLVGGVKKEKAVKVKKKHP